MRGVGHDRRMLDQALDAAQALGQREDLAALEEALGVRQRALEDRRHHAAEAVHLPLAPARAADGSRGRDSSTRAIFGCFSSQCGDGQRVPAVALHAQRQRLQAAQRQEAVERAGDGADGVLQERQLLAQLRRCRRPRRCRR